MRYAKPKSGKFSEISENIMESGDGAWYPVVGGITSAATSIAGTIAIVSTSNPVLALFYVPAAAFAITVIGYVKGTDHLPSKAGGQYNTAKYKLMPKIEGTFVEEYATPILEQIWDHSMDGHPGENKAGGCRLCQERLDVMTELIPKKATNKDDIQRAKLFIEERKKYELT